MTTKPCWTKKKRNVYKNGNNETQKLRSKWREWVTSWRSQIRLRKNLKREYCATSLSKTKWQRKPIKKRKIKPGRETLRLKLPWTNRCARETSSESTKTASIESTWNWWLNKTSVTRTSRRRPSERQRRRGWLSSGSSSCRSTGKRSLLSSTICLERTRMELAGQKGLWAPEVLAASIQGELLKMHQVCQSRNSA